MTDSDSREDPPGSPPAAPHRPDPPPLRVSRAERQALRRAWRARYGADLTDAQVDARIDRRLAAFGAWYGTRRPRHGWFDFLTGIGIATMGSRPVVAFAGAVAVAAGIAAWAHSPAPFAVEAAAGPVGLVAEFYGRWPILGRVACWTRVLCLAMAIVGCASLPYLLQAR